MTTLALPAQAVLDRRYLPGWQQAAVGFLSQYRGSTLKCYTLELQRFFAWCEQRNLDPFLVQRADLNLFVHDIQTSPARYAESTISRWVGTVCGYYRYACDEEMIPKDPGRRITRPQVDHDKQRCTFLPPVEFATLIKYVTKHGTPTERALIGLIGLRGLRISEACSLDVDDFIEQGGYRVVRFIGKGNKARTVVLPVPVVRAIEACIGDRTAGPILLNAVGNRMDRKVSGRMVKDLAARAGVDPDISNHSLRRSFVTAAIAKGESLLEVSLTVGHAQTSTTQRYDRLTKSLDRDISQSVAGFLSNLAG